MTTTTSKQLNGIDLDVLGRLADDVANKPGGEACSFGALTRWVGGTRADTRVISYSLGGKDHARDFTIGSDEPAELCGTSKHPNPQELLLAALNSCMIVGYAANAAAMGIELRSLEIETSGDLDLRGFLAMDATVKPGYDALHSTVRIESDAAPEKLEELRRHVERTSVNRFNLAHPIRLTSDLVVGR